MNDLRGVGQPLTGLLRSPKKEGRPDTCHDTHEPRRRLPSDLSRSLKGRCSDHEHKIPTEARFLETESRMGFAGGGWEAVSHGDRVSVWKDGKFWRWLAVTFAQQCE